MTATAAEIQRPRRRLFVIPLVVVVHLLVCGVVVHLLICGVVGHLKGTGLAAEDNQPGLQFAVAGRLEMPATVYSRRLKIDD